MFLQYESHIYNITLSYTSSEKIHDSSWRKSTVFCGEKWFHINSAFFKAVSEEILQLEHNCVFLEFKHVQRVKINSYKCSAVLSMALSHAF